MKLLLDENVPRKLKFEIHGHEVFTVPEMGWSSKKNGELLKSLLENNFDALVTVDKNLAFQQNFSSYPIPVFILNAKDSRLDSLKSLVQKLLEKIPVGGRGPIIISDSNI
jgi:hypothetical protein